MMSLLMLPLAYEKSTWTLLTEYLLGNLPKGFAWDTYIPMVIAIYYCCFLVHIIITVFLIEKIRINADFIKKALTLVLPVCVIGWWGTPGYWGIPNKACIDINMGLDKTVFMSNIIKIILANWIFSECFEYINMRAKGKWYVTNSWKYGLGCSNLIYYICYAVLTLLALYINNQIVVVVSAVLLIGLSVLLGLSRKSINNLIACEIAIMTVSMHTYKLIDLEMCICVLLSSYFTEQLQIWINRSIKGTTSQEQSKYISDIKKKVLSGYGVIGIITFIIITLLERGL